VSDEPEPKWFTDHEEHDNTRFAKLEAGLAALTTRQTFILSAVTAIATAVGVFAHHYING